MSEYRNRTTGEIKTQGQWRKDFPNTSFPRVWTTETLESLDLDAVLSTPEPTPGQYQNAVRNGVVQDANSNWVQAWEVRDMFADTTDEDGNVTTKAEHEAAYEAGLSANVAKSNRTKRDGLLAETDWMALSDVTMSAEMTTYRQALRDITNNVNWPNLDEADWPVKP